MHTRPATGGALHLPHCLLPSLPAACCLPALGTQAPPGVSYEAPFLTIAKALQQNYEDTVKAYEDACRNY